MLNYSDYHIIRDYQARYRGVVNYYCMAHNIDKLSKVKWASQTSLLKTLAGKHKSSVVKMIKKYQTTKKVYGFTYKVLQATVERDGKKPLISYYGAIPLKRNPRPASITDDIWKNYGRRYKVIDRLNADKCEMCGIEGPVEMHHRNPINNVHKKGKNSLTAWEVRMIAMRRITLAVCWPCHKAITYGKSLLEWDAYKKQLAQNGLTEKAG
jgi:hypothetical protein